jgi:hypothetical protein
MAIDIIRIKRKARSPWVLVLLFFIVAGAVWLGAERTVLYVRMHSPLPKEWASVQLANGEILFGHLSGMGGDVVGLSDVYVLEKFTPSSSETQSSSMEFSLSGTASGQSATQLVPVKRTSFLFINRSMVLYWKFLDADDPIVSYLR